MTLSYAKAFRRDCKVISKRRWNIRKLKSRLSELDKECDWHMLKGKFAGKRECHISFDWVLVYVVAGDVIKLLRTGTHAEVLDY